MTQAFRLSAGGQIDRSKPVSFRFDGKRYQGYSGDTLASALIANGVHMVGRSFKYHRPRGILGAGSEDPAGIVQIGNDPARTDPNTRATEIEIYDGLETFAQNCYPSLKRDVGAVNDIFSRFFAAGFYYKTFMGPPFNWMFFEPFIRKAAGLGVSPTAIDPDHYEHTNRHCDVLVVGGGAAGLTAAYEAGRTGARVIVCDEKSKLGGSLLGIAPSQNQIDGLAPDAWAESMRAKLAAMPDVTILTRTCAFGYYAENFIGLAENLQDHVPLAERDPSMPRHRLWRVRAKRVVLAGGTVERPLIFHQNDRPGIMLSSAASAYLHRYGVRPGNTVVASANNNDGWQGAFDLAAAGADVRAIVDTRSDVPEELRARADALGIAVYANHSLVGSEGRHHIHGVMVQERDGNGGVKGFPERLPCDLLTVSGGWSPNIALFSQSRGKLRYDPDLAGFRPHQSWQKEASAGGSNGTMRLAAAIAEGAAAGAEAAAEVGYDKPNPEIPQVVDAHAAPFAVEPMWELPSGRSKASTRAFIDTQNDVTAKDLRLAVQEGYKSVEHAKRYTTTGMGTDQGKVIGVNAFGILGDATGKPIADVGVTTYRQPYKPISFGAVAGQHVGKNFHPRRTTPMHEWHVEAGATFEVVGDWLRARTYPINKETFDQAVQRETHAARTGIGLLDASTLGKIDIRGKDAAEFLNRIYTNAWLKLKVGSCRYGLMLNEDGMVFDDGVTARIADDHFHMTTTTGGAAGVLGWLEEYHQTEWSDLEVYMTTVTEQWGVASICGPECDKVVRELVDAEFVDAMDPDNFPFMAWKPVTIGGVPARIFRISFTGELSYEINVPATYGLWLWRRLMDLGASHGITPYGTEAMHVLRAEKGFIIVGQDTDGTITPHDLRMSWAVKKTADFVGRRSLSRPDTARTDRPQLVGLVTRDPKFVIEEGAQLINPGADPTPPVPMQGYVTSSYYSPNANRSIALALVKGGGERMGDVLHVSRADGPPIPVTVTDTDFLTAKA